MGMCTTIFSLVLLFMLTLRSCRRNMRTVIQKQAAQAFCKVLLIRFPMGGKMMVQVWKMLIAHKPPKTFLPKLLAENEQATYASANNDLKGTKAYQEADVAGLYNLSMAIIDYRGHRVVAQATTQQTYSKLQ